MPELCDFTQIVGDSPITIGDSQPVWEASFQTGGRSAASTAFLIFNVRGLTFADTNVVVKVNNQPVGHIVRYGGVNKEQREDTANYWYTQMIALQGSTLKDPTNEIQIEAVGWSGAAASNRFDDFELKNVICFFHQIT